MDTPSFATKNLILNNVSVSADSSGFVIGSERVNTNSTITGFVSNTGLTQTLSGYTTTGALNTSLSFYTTTAGLTTILSGYPTTGSLNTTLSGYVRTGVLTGYVTNTGLTGTLAGYVSTGNLSGTLSGYVQTGTLNSYTLKSLFTGHTGNLSNPHNVTKTQIGLGNVSNTAQIALSTLAQPNGVATLNENLVLAQTGNWNNLSGVPSVLTTLTTNSANIVDFSNVTAKFALVSGNGSSLTNLNKTQVGLLNVENTALTTWTGSTSITRIGTLSTGNIPWGLVSSKPTTVTGYGITDATYNPYTRIDFDQPSEGVTFHRVTFADVFPGFAPKTVFAEITPYNFTGGFIQHSIPITGITNTGFIIYFSYPFPADAALNWAVYY